MHKAALFLLLSPLACQAMAQTAAGEHRLSPQEVNQILDDAASKREASEVTVPVEKFPVHGEVGVTIGTGGYRSVYGTANVGLADDGFASFSFGSERNRDWGWVRQ